VPGSILYDPIGTAIRVSLACMLAGMLFGLVAVAIIHTGSTRLAPRLSPRQIWQGWRRKRMVWGLGLTIPLLTSGLLTELVARRLGLADIYWMAREDALLWLGRLAGVLGYLLLLFVVVIVALIRKKRTPRPDDTSKSEA
jgi:hypothetical protein